MEVLPQSLQRLDGIPDASPVACLVAFALGGIPNRKGTSRCVMMTLHLGRDDRVKENAVSLLHFGSTNPCRITRKVEQTKMYVCTLEEFILVDVVTLLYKLELNMHWKCCSLYTIATIEEKG